MYWVLGCQCLQAILLSFSINILIFQYFAYIFSLFQYFTKSSIYDICTKFSQFSVFLKFYQYLWSEFSKNTDKSVHTWRHWGSRESDLHTHLPPINTHKFWSVVRLWITLQHFTLITLPPAKGVLLISAIVYWRGWFGKDGHYHIPNNYRAYANRMQAKKIITNLNFVWFSGKGRHTLHKLLNEKS